jgi:hypothetical protein
MSEQRYLFYSDADTHCQRDIGPDSIVISTAGEWCVDPGAAKRGHFDWSPCKDMGATLHGLRIYRDDLRKGWHCVPEGVRYVAVKGIKAGQWTWGGGQRLTTSMEDALFSASEYNKCRRWRESGSIKRFDGDDWCVLDLHDLADHRQRKHACSCDLPHCPTCGEHTCDHRKPTGATRPADERLKRMSAPTDAEIMEKWESSLMGMEKAGTDPYEIMLARTAGLCWTLHGEEHQSSWAEYQAARSRELKRRQEDAREKERRRVVCEGTLPEDY